MTTMALRRLVAFAAGLVVAAVLSASVFYAVMGTARSYALRAYDAPRGASNAILHAYAAAETYAAARAIGMGRRRAAAMTEWLGHLNEWAEFHGKRLDDTAEVYKDLHVNLMGITAARWLEAREGRRWPVARLRLVTALAKQGELPWWSTDPRLPSMPAGHDPSPAMVRYAAERSRIAAATIATLEAGRDAFSAAAAGRVAPR